jgi:hypothetical protein
VVLEKIVEASDCEDGGCYNCPLCRKPQVRGWQGQEGQGRAGGWQVVVHAGAWGQGMVGGGWLVCCPGHLLEAGP